jgi:hypothetical protein
MKIHKISCLAIFLIIVTGINIADAQSKGKMAKISSIIGKTGGCGSAGGNFDAFYAGKQIQVTFTYSKTKVYKGNKQIKGPFPDDIFNVGIGKTHPLSGTHIEVEGFWYNPTTFEAKKIFLPQNVTVNK